MICFFIIQFISSFFISFLFHVSSYSSQTKCFGKNEALEKMLFPFLSPPSLPSLSTYFFLILFTFSKFIKHKAIDYKIVFWPFPSNLIFCSAKKKSCILLPPSHLLLTFRGMDHLGLQPQPQPRHLSLLYSYSFVSCQLHSVQLCSLCQNKLWNLISPILRLSLPWESKFVYVCVFYTRARVYHFFFSIFMFWFWYYLRLALVDIWLYLFIYFVSLKENLRLIKKSEFTSLDH